GAVFGSLGDLSGLQMMYDGELNHFVFNNTTAATYFRVVIDKTSFSAGYALFRMFPLTSSSIVTMNENDTNVAISGVSVGPLAEDASLVARRLGSFARGLYASPDYLARRGTPQAPEQLAGHDALLLAPQAGRPLPMSLQNGLQEWHGPWASRFGANSVELLVRMALAGAGLVAIDERFVRPHLAAGTLLPVLPAWTLPPVTAWAVMPGRRLMPAKTRAFVEALIRTLADDKGD
ncbi:MAG TPA: substrate binding domain-containing protein, partial [Plasticicumulans sp.]|nr:substrate binding domain-containing protein [Plasticicumulans sp.]